MEDSERRMARANNVQIVNGSTICPTNTSTSVRSRAGHNHTHLNTTRDSASEHIDTGTTIHQLRDEVRELFTGDRRCNDVQSSDATRGRYSWDHYSDTSSSSLNPNHPHRNRNATNASGIDNARYYSTSPSNATFQGLGNEALYGGNLNYGTFSSSNADANARSGWSTNTSGNGNLYSSGRTGNDHRPGTVASNLQQSRAGYLENPLINPEADSSVRASQDNAFQRHWGGNRADRANNRTGSGQSSPRFSSVASGLDQNNSINYNYGTTSRYGSNNNNNNNNGSTNLSNLTFADDKGNLQLRTDMHHFTVSNQEKPLEKIESYIPSTTSRTSQTSQPSRTSSPFDFSWNTTTTDSRRQQQSLPAGVLCIDTMTESPSQGHHEQHRCYIVSPRKRLSRDNTPELREYAKDLQRSFSSSLPSTPTTQFSEESQRWVQLPTSSVNASNVPNTVIILNGKQGNGKHEAIILTEDQRLCDRARRGEAREDLRHKVRQSRENARRYIQDRERNIQDSIVNASHSQRGFGTDANTSLPVSVYSARDWSNANRGGWTSADSDSDAVRSTLNELTDDEIEEILDDAFIMGFSEFE